MQASPDLGHLHKLNGFSLPPSLTDVNSSGYLQKLPMNPNVPWEKSLFSPKRRQIVDHPVKGKHSGPQAGSLYKVRAL